MSEHTSHTDTIKTIYHPSAGDVPVGGTEGLRHGRPAGSFAEGMRRMDARAETDIAPALRARAIQERAYSPEVNEEDHEAQFVLFGNQGHKYYDKESGTWTTGKEKGLLDSLADDPHVSRVPEERRAVADAMRARVEEMCADKEVDGKVVPGLKLSQARIVVEATLHNRNKAQEIQGEMLEHIGRLVKGGMDHEQAQTRVQGLKKYREALAGIPSMEQIEAFVRERGIFTRQDYKRSLKGEDLYAGGKYNPAETGADPSDPDDPNKNKGHQLSPEEQKQYDALYDRVIRARNNYTKLAAKRGTKSFGGAKELEEARQAYIAARDEAGGAIAHLFQEAGFTEDEINDMAYRGARDEGHWLAESLKYERQMATGRYDSITRDDGNKVAIPKNGLRYRATRGFYNWWNRQQGVKGALAKAGVMVAGGAVIGMTAGAVLPLTGGIAGLAGGALVAGRISKAFMATRITKNADAERAQAYSNELYNSIFDQADAYRDRGAHASELGTDELTESVENQVDSLVARNRKRLGKAAFAAAGGALLGEAIGAVAGTEGSVDHLFHHGHSGNADHKVLGNDGHTNSGTGAHHNGAGNHKHEGNGGDTTNPPEVNPGDYRYPYDWANHEWPHHAMNQLRKLGNLAKADGHHVEWRSGGNGVSELWVDGTDNTDHVISVLNQYR